MAPEELVQPYARIHEEAFAVERVHFKKTKKRTSPNKVDPFLTLEGRLPVMVSAPHSVRQVRQGKVRPSAEFTGSLAFLLHRETGCHVVSVKKLYGGDPAWDDPCLYKERLREEVDRHAIRVILDLQGVGRERGVDVGLRTAGGPGLRTARQIAGTLREALKAEGIRRVSERVAEAGAQHTVLRFCSEVLGVPTVEIEINHRYRAPNRNGADYRLLFRALATSIPTIAAPV